MSSITSTNDVHLWWTSTDVCEGTHGILAGILSLDEHDRAVQFRIADDRRRFVVARAMIRCVLALYLGRTPEQIRFQFGPYGKPRLENLGSEEGLEFNLSHSHKLALCAVARGRKVGVDIERIDPVADLERLAAFAFSLTEQQTLATLSGEQRLIGFYNCWTRKEAYVKARGDGFFLPLDAFDVSLVPGERARVLANRLDPPDTSRWSLHEITPVDNYVGALAVQGRRARICVRRWDKPSSLLA